MTSNLIIALLLIPSQVQLYRALLLGYISYSILALKKGHARKRCHVNSWEDVDVELRAKMMTTTPLII